MIPNIIIVDESGPENGANVHTDCVVVRKDQVDKLKEGFALAFPDIEFKIYTKAEYETFTKKKEAGSNNQ